MSFNTIPETPGTASELNIRDYLDIIQRRRAVFIQVFVLLLAMGIVGAAVSKPVYQTYAKLQVPVGSSSVNIVDSNNPIAAFFLAMQPDSLDTQLQVLQSGPFQEDARREAHVLPRPGIVPPSVKVETLGDNSNIILITVEGGDPQEITRLANTIVDQHLQRTDRSANHGLHGATQIVRGQKEKAEKTLADIDRKLALFRKAHPGVEPDTERAQRAGEYAALLTRVLELESSVSSSRALLVSLRARLAREPRELVEETTKDNPRVGKIRDKLDDLSFQRMDLLREYRPTSRTVQDLDRQITQLRRQLEAEPKEIHVRSHSPNPTRALLQTRLEEMESNLQRDETSLNSARGQFKSKKALLDSMAPWEIELGRLNRSRDAIQNAYTLLANQLRDLEIRSVSPLPTPRVIERAAVPATPIRPRKAQSIFLSALMALVLAVSTVFLQEFLDDRVHSPEDVERLAVLRPLAHVPLMGSDQPRLVAELPANSPVAEAYRSLRSSIGFAGIDAPIRRLQVTSALPGEGKSTTSVNLATAMANDGKRVILIDADMRWPSVHRLLDLANSPGLSEVLVGMKRLDEALQATDNENLQVVAAGAIPPNPAELLGSNAFGRLLEQLDGQADVVIIDTPPCLPVTDPLIVAARTDGVVLVLHVGKTRKGGARQAVELLSQARARILGAVFNQVPAHRKGYYYYRQYHYYGYGYGYHTDPGERRGRQLRNGKSHYPALESGRAVAVDARRTQGEEEA